MWEEGVCKYKCLCLNFLELLSIVYRLAKVQKYNSSPAQMIKTVHFDYEWKNNSILNIKKVDIQ